MRIGFGFDTHKLTENIPFFIGGIKIQHYKGSIGHSDADVLIHAICDALLGAAALPDIGQQFPDNDSKYKGIDSKILLKKVVELIKKERFSISNIDSTIVLQKPKLATYIPTMKECLAKILDINENQISIKAKTSENIGFIGREEGVSAYAIVLLDN